MKYLPYILCLLLLGCYNQKKATRQVIKADTKFPIVLDGYCGQTRPPLDSVDTKIVYKEGETIHDTVTRTETKIHNDTVYKTEYNDIYIKQRDTIEHTVYKQQTNKGLINKLNKQKEDLVITLSATKARLNMLKWVAIILGIYTIGRWVLRIWKIRLP